MIKIQDDVNVLSAADRSSLENSAHDWPFDVSLLVSSNYAGNNDLSEEVGHRVDAPNMLSIGIDPVHHHAQIHFGTGTGVPQALWDHVFKAGKPFLHDGRWVDGVNAMAQDAASVRVRTQTGQPIPPIQEKTSFGEWAVWGCVLGLVLVLGYFLFRSNRRKSVSDATFEAGDGYAPPPRAPRYTSQSYVPPYIPPTPPVIVNNGNDGFVEGVILGEMMSQPRDVIVEHVYEQPAYSPPAYDPPTPDSSPSVMDMGGSGGGFDGGGFDGGGFDGGGTGGDI